MEDTAKKPLLPACRDPLPGDSDLTAIVNAFSVDVEDYFQVECFRNIIDSTTWDSRRSRVVESTNLVLSLLELGGIRATFFVLGWIAERFPSLVQRIGSAGHEVASHGYSHNRVSDLSPMQFREEIGRTKRLLEDCCGNAVRGFRAPTFSINRSSRWAYEILGEEGYTYSSSVYPITHDLYGWPEAPRRPFNPIDGSDFLEIPIATVRLMGANRPCGGGGYFRLIPYPLTRWCIRRINAGGMAGVFYCHPWEFDLEQPYISEAPLKSRLRHYLNIGRMEGRAAQLLRDFRWGRMDHVFLIKEKSHALVGANDFGHHFAA